MKQERIPLEERLHGFRHALHVLVARQQRVDKLNDRSSPRCPYRLHQLFGLNTHRNLLSPSGDAYKTSVSLDL